MDRVQVSALQADALMQNYILAGFSDCQGHIHLGSHERASFLNEYEVSLAPGIGDVKTRPGNSVVVKWFMPTWYIQLGFCEEIRLFRVAFLVSANVKETYWNLIRILNQGE